jgi:hypothetical protein
MTENACTVLMRSSASLITQLPGDHSDGGRLVAGVSGTPSGWLHYSNADIEVSSTKFLKNSRAIPT